jgi:hypothetical protein
MVGLLGRVISPSQGLYLHRTTQHSTTQKDTYKHPCLKRYSFYIQTENINDIENSEESMWSYLTKTERRQSEDKCLEIAKGFEKEANFPNCTGEIDGNHIRIINRWTVTPYFITIKIISLYFC